MIKVLYYDEEQIIDSLAESLVIGGLPKNDKVPTQENLGDEIRKLQAKLYTIWKYKELLDFNKKDKQIRVKQNLSKEIMKTYAVDYSDLEYLNEYCQSIDIYCKRGRTLGNVATGSGHNSLFKGVQFNMVINFPLYWLKEYQRYHFTDIISSQSTMHKVLEFNLEDMFSDEVDPRCIEIIKDLREQYKKESNKDEKKKIWRRIINSLSDGFNMSMGITMNYLQLTTMIPQREHHKLSEWSEDLIPFFKELPYYDFFLID